MILIRVITINSKSFMALYPNLPSQCAHHPHLSEIFFTSTMKQWLRLFPVYLFCCWMRLNFTVGKDGDSHAGLLCSVLKVTGTSEVQLCNIRALSMIINSVCCPSWSGCYLVPYLPHVLGSFLSICFTMFCNVFCMHVFSKNTLCLIVWHEKRNSLFSLCTVFV